MSSTVPLQLSYRAVHIGSFLRPNALFEKRQQLESKQCTPSDLRSLEDAAIKHVVELQRNVGIKTVSDGEFRRLSWTSMLCRPSYFDLPLFIGAFFMKECLINLKAWYICLSVSFISSSRSWSWLIPFFCAAEGPISTFKVKQIASFRSKPLLIVIISQLYIPRFALLHDAGIKSVETFFCGVRIHCLFYWVHFNYPLSFPQGKIKRTRSFYVDDFNYLKSLVPPEVCVPIFSSLFFFKKKKLAISGC